jgi:uncharacterized protein (DUF58 family)
MRNFILFTLVLFVLAALLRIDFFFTIFYLFIGVYLASRLWARNSLKKVQVTRTLPERAFLGEEVTVRLRVSNHSILPVLWLMVNESFSTILASPPFYRRVISLDSRSEVTMTYDLVARRRGYYDIGPMRVETGDLLGINQGLHGFIQPSHLIVYPKIIPITQLKLPTHSPQVVLPTAIPLFKDTTRLLGVKGYMAGDNPRHIHWPASAKQGQTLVKQFETAIARDNAIFLDLNRTGYGRSGQATIAIELAIVVAASLANHIINREELPVGLYTTGLDPLSGKPRTFQLAPNKGRSHLMQMLEILARLEGHPDEVSFADRLQHHALHLGWGTTVTFITSMTTKPLLEKLLLMKRAGFQVALTLVQPAAYNYPPEQLAQKINLPVYKVTREKDIERWLPTR